MTCIGRVPTGRCRRPWGSGPALAPCLALVVIAALVPPTSIEAQDPVAAVVEPSWRHEPAIGASRSLLAALVREANLPGLQVAVWWRGGVAWSKGLGYADLEHGTPVSTSTRFRIGSLSKPLTAAAVVALAEDGVLDLDAPIGRYLPSLPESARRITARQLAGHLAGVRHYAESESQIRHESYGSVTEALALFVDDPLLHPPGSDYEYSSYGYTLLGAVLEGATGRPYLAVLREAVLGPLGLAGTVADHVDSIIPHRARPYLEAEDGRLLNAPSTNNSYKWPSGGLLSTAEDLVAFAAGLAAGALVEPASVPRLFESMVTTTGDTTGYAFGWRPRTDATGRRVVRHGGSSVGGRAFLLLYPDAGLAVALLVNASLAPVFQEEAEPIAHFFLDHDPEAGPIRSATEALAGRYAFEAGAGDERVAGTLYLSGDATRPGWIDWEGSARPVPLVVADDHGGGEVVLLGAGVHGFLMLRARFGAEGFTGAWNWLGRTRDITGRRREVEGGG